VSKKAERLLYMKLVHRVGAVVVVGAIVLVLIYRESVDELIRHIINSLR
jgi:hypothetical protein